MCWKPHPAQAQVKNALFTKGSEKVFLECGRKFGKTDFLNYILHRFALLFPNSACYFIAPFQKQAKELLWANNRLQNFFFPNIDPKTGLSPTGLSRLEASQVYEEMKAKYGVVVNNTEMRIKFGNGSFIKLDGADQYEAYRGVNPHIIVYDEFKDHHPKFHDGMDPNLATFNAPLIIVGTPPEGDEDNAPQYIEMADYCFKDKNSAYFNKSSYCNPHISSDWLDKKRQELIDRNREDVWLREYMAQRVLSGSRAIFPMLKFPEPERGITHTDHIRPHEEVKDKVLKYHKSWDFYLVFDPASVSCFGVLFGAINKHTKQVVLLDEIYETSKAKMGTANMFAKALEMVQGYGVLTDDIRMVYDNAAAWFYNEVVDQFDYALEPCSKDIKKKGEHGKENRLNCIKDMLLFNYLVISDNCVKMVWEMKYYRTDDKGNIPKENDHLLDCLRYMLSADWYTHVPQRAKLTENIRRFHTPDSDRDKYRREKDPFYEQVKDFYE